MSRLVACLVVVALLLTTPAWGQPRVWSDDFTAMVTYNSTSWLAPCYGGPLTKYTVLEIEQGSFANDKVNAGAGLFILTNKSKMALAGHFSAAVIGALNVGPPCAAPGVPFFESTEPFTSDDLCMYIGVIFSPYQTESQVAYGTFSIKGPDGKPGVADVDDDADGVTDDDDECPAARATTVGAGYGNPDGTGFWAGPDGAPGVVSIDDDANGTTDDVGETRTPGSDDTDDVTRQVNWFLMNGEMQTSSGIVLSMDILYDWNAFSLWEFVDYQSSPVEHSRELPVGFFDPEVHYNIAFCASGDCYGAILWTETDMANPDETLGPVKSTYHSGPNANYAVLAWYQESQPQQYIRRERLMGNSNFNDTFYIISGDARTHFPPIDADFDGDKDVDGQDFMKFSACFNGSLRPPKTGCANPEANFDGDIDVDGQDFMAFSKCFNGSLRRPKCLPPILTNCPP